MVNIILCGTAGTGKHRLIAELRKQCRPLKKHGVIQGIANEVFKDFNIETGADFHCDDSVYEAVQRAIIDRQCSAELQCNSGYITDNCVISCLVHADMCLADEYAADRIGSINNVQLQELLKRYRSSLVVLMCYQSSNHHQSIGLQCTAQEGNTSSVKKTYKTFMKQYSIPFIEIAGPAMEHHTKSIEAAIQGKISLYSASLENYEVQKHVDQGKKASSVEVQNSFCFFKAPDGPKTVIQIPTIKIKEQSYEQTWTSYWPGKTNRFISVHGYENLACIKFQNSVRSSRVQKTLLNGVVINGESYSFMGCSSGGLKKRKCFLWKGTAKDARSKIESLGDFSTIKSVSKRLARIALLFTEVNLTTLQVSDNVISHIHDVTGNRHTFTDGCGLIGKNLAAQVFDEVKQSMYDEIIPSVYQIRLKGYKGVLALDPNMEDKIGVRPSMEKFATDQLRNIGVCDYSRPNTFGSLNKQFIILLSALGVRDESFLDKQKQYLRLLDSMMHNAESAVMMLQWQNKFDVAQLIAKAGHIESVQAPQKKLVQSELKNVQNSLKGKVEKLSILVPNSRTVFGICDPISELEYGECFLRLTLAGRPTTVRGKVVVCKNPCYLLGDVRVLTAVSEANKPGLRNLHHLVDCIVFPVKGKRPHPTEIAGSDLDGDKYFVSWDTELIPNVTRPPYDYPAMAQKQDGVITTEKIIEYFSRQNETGKLMGKLNRFFLYWADKKGASCVECDRLGQLFSRAVDSLKTGETLTIPHILEPNQDDSAPGESVQVWQVMAKNAETYKESVAQTIVQQNDTAISEDFVFEILGQERANITEFDKFRFVWNFTKNKLKLDDQACVDYFMNNYGQFIHFSKLSIEEKREALLAGFPRKMLLNALTTSSILSEDDLHHFMMDSPVCTWKHLISTEQEYFDWKNLLKALTTYDKILLVIAMPDGVVIQVQFSEKQNLGKELAINPGNITVIFISKHFGYRNKYVLGPSFSIDLTEDTLQLYRDMDRTQTLIWLKKTDIKLTKGRPNKRLSDEIVNSVSMDIQRFPSVNSKGRHPLINKIPFVEIEMYAQIDGDEETYWDQYDANDVPEINEQVETETEDEYEFDNIVTESHFPEVTFDCMLGDCNDDGYIVKIYEAVVKGGNPIQLLGLCKMYPLEPTQMLHHVIIFLENVISMTIPYRISENLYTVIREIIDILLASMEGMRDTIKHVDILTLTCNLSRLNMQDKAHQAVIKLAGSMSKSTEYFLEALGELYYFWFLETKTRLAILEICYRSFPKDSYYGDGDTLQVSQTGNVSECADKIHLEPYIQHYGLLHGLHLLHEMSAHENLTTDPFKGQNVSLTGLRLDHTTQPDPITFTFYKTSAVSLTGSFIVGQTVAIIVQKLANHGPTSRSVCALGVIHDLMVAPLTVTVKIEHRVPDMLTNAVNKQGVRYWRLDVVGNIIAFKRVTAAIQTIWNEQSDSSIMAVVSNTNDCMVEKAVYLQEHDENENQETKLDGLHEKGGTRQATIDGLNEEQTRAVITSINEKMCLIQGPPGTGKTSVACRIVKQVVTGNTFNGVLVVAETNAAVDNLARRLRNELLIVRIGTASSNDLFDITLEGHLKNITANEARKTTYRGKQGDLRRNPNLVKRVVSSADVVLATCIGAGEMALSGHSFEFVLVDEATKTMETTLMCALAHGAKHLVMIGDHKQLGPLVPGDKLVPGSDDLPNIQELSQSLFHRIYNSVPVCFLETQYRMHPEIMKFPSKEFYDNRLIAEESTRIRDPIEFDWPAGKHVPICFIDVEGKERKQGSSYANDREADVVEQVVHRLLHSDFYPGQKDDRAIGVSDIGILTLYQGQEKVLRGRIQSSNITVKSVDGFQGQEREVIVVSTVRCNDRRAVGFSGDPNRINVLLTRSKRGLIVIGNSRTLAASPIWERWLMAVPFLYWPVKKLCEPKKCSTRLKEKNVWKRRK